MNFKGKNLKKYRFFTKQTNFPEGLEKITVFDGKNNFIQGTILLYDRSVRNDRND